MYRIFFLFFLMIPLRSVAQVFPFEEVKNNLTSYYLMNEPELMNELRARQVTDVITRLPQDDEVGDQVMLELFQKGKLDYNLAKEFVTSMRSNGSWADINYSDTNRSGWDPKRHAERVLFLTKVYLTKESPMYKAERLSAAIHSALKFWFESSLICSNWWYNQIGIPKTFGPVFIMLENELSAQEKEAAVKVMDQSKFGMTGQNKVWLAGNVLFKALLTRDAALGLEARNLILSEIIVSSGEGIQEDYSFHQHGPQQQFGNYGLSFVSNMTYWGRLFKGTPLELDVSQKMILKRFMLSAFDWMVWKGTFDINGMGRQLFKGAQQAKALAVATTMIDMSLIDPLYKKEYLDFIDRNYSDSKTVAPLIGNVPFWRSDQMIHRSASWFASVKMSSPRVIGAESVNGDNLKGYYLADGATYVLVDGEEYENIFPIWDWKKIPGITSYQNAEPLKVLTLEGYRNGSDFTGGLSNGGLSIGAFGVAAMHLERDSLSAKKAWFFMDRLMICLGTGINGFKDSEVSTTLNQCRLKGAVVYFDGAKKVLADSTTLSLSNHLKWVFHNSVGYYFLEPAQATLSNKRQQGDWREVNSSSKSEKAAGDVFALSWEHGTKPENGSYAYAIIPNCSVESLESTALSALVLRNDEFCQGVMSKNRLVLMLVIHKPVNMVVPQVGALEMRVPGLYIFEKGVTGWTVSLSDPTHKRDKISFRKDGKTHEVALPTGSKAGMSVSIFLD